jgi:peptide/nickel transport system permease protein
VTATSIVRRAPRRTRNADSHFLLRLLRRPLALACVAYLATVSGIAAIAPVLMPDVAKEHAGDLFAVRQGPSSAHLLGTDALGRDVLDRLLVGAQPTLIGVAEAVAVVLALGIPLGLAAGFFRGRTDRVISSVADIAFALPSLVIVIVVLAVFPQSMLAGMTTLGVLMAPSLMRVVRSATLQVREELYIAAARVSGLTHFNIMRRHVLPRIAGPVIVQTSLLCAAALLVQTGLSFLNLLAAPPAPSWGGMVSEGVGVIVLQPWLIWPPGLAIAITILAFGLLGDVVRDASTERWSTIARAPRARYRPAPSVAGSAAESGRADTSGALLSVRDLAVSFPARDGRLSVVDGVSFDIGPGEVVGLVGETGCGKTVTAMSILRLLPGSGQIDRGRVVFDGREISALPEGQLRAVRGKEIALISQDPMVSLNPVYRVGWQLGEAVRQHQGLSRGAAKRRVVELLSDVQLPDPEAVAMRYPHELSGGMAQRVGIARALAGEPRLLIADEPTTALDVTIQAEILDLLRGLQRDRGMAILLVTHDWGVVADICDRAVVMYAGQVVERAQAHAMFDLPLHPYTRALLAANPHHDPETNRLATIPGAVPAPGTWPAGCRFLPRCAYGTAICGEGPIPLESVDDRETRCIRHELLAVQE